MTPPEKKDERIAEEAYSIWRGSHRQKIVPAHWDDLGEGWQDMLRFVVAHARIGLEAENSFVREKLGEYIRSGFDPGMMAPTLDDIRHGLKIEAK